MCGSSVEGLGKQSRRSREEAGLIFTNNFSGSKQAGGIIGDVIASEIDSEPQIVSAVNFRQVVSNLVLGYISALRPIVQIAAKIIEGTTAETQAIRHESSGRGHISGLENRAVPGSRKNELIGGAAAEGMGFVQLAFILGLGALRIEYAVDGIGVGGLDAVVTAEVDIGAIVIADILVHARSKQPLMGEVARGGAE